MRVLDSHTHEGCEQKESKLVEDRKEFTNNHVNGTECDFKKNNVKRMKLLGLTGDSKAIL